MVEPPYNSSTRLFKGGKASQGHKRGIRAVIFVTSNIPQKKGDSALSVLPPGLDIVDFANGLATANAKAREAFYGPHMADDVADSFMSALLPQSEEALLGPVSVGLEDLTVPAYYVICENDRAIDPDTQRNIVDMIPTLKRVLHNPGGHSAFITHVNEFIDQVLGIADELEIWD
ncbi:hypothetical protein TrVFT333_006471 [Trichoderma virens FT-333]|nr:hypothetical protein TrVFT333_006471 [Trichoderma virens FT-333]